MARPVEFRFSAESCMMAAAALLILPLRWILGAFFAAVFHELCHYAALRLCSVRILRLTVGAGGAVMETEPMNRIQEFLCAMAGPLGSFFLVCLYRWLPVAAVCGGIQGLYNLLPLGTLDGGRMMRCLVGVWIYRIVEKCVIVLLIFAGLYGFIGLNLGIGVLIPVFLLVERTVIRKTPCKDGPLGVQ